MIGGGWAVGMRAFFLRHAKNRPGRPRTVPIAHKVSLIELESTNTHMKKALLIAYSCFQLHPQSTVFLML